MKKIVKLLLMVGCFMLSASVAAQSQVHVVQQGETVYAIARKYNVGPNEIIKANPILGDGEKIRPGQSLTIPAAGATSVAATKPGSATTGSRLHPGYKEMYRVQKKDNLYKIALQFGLTIEELLEANPELTVDSKLKRDSFIYIPYSKAEKQAEQNRLAAEKAAAEKAAAEAARKAPKKLINVGVVLPLKEGGDRGGKMIEFYRGMLMAADSVKQQGVAIHMHAYHSGSSLEDINFVINTKPELKNMDVIFGPLNTTQAGVLSKFCQENKIRLVTPFSTTNSVGQDNPYVYQASAHGTAARQAGAEMMVSRFTNSNYVFLQTGMSDTRGTGFVTEVRKLLEGRGMKAVNLKVEDSDEAFVKVLNQYRDNVIIPDASSLSATTTLVRKLKAFQTAHPEYRLTLAGYPEWPTYAATLQADFCALNTYAYCTFFRNPTDTRVSAFEGRYLRNFKEEVSRTYPRYGLFGFDLAYFFLHGLATYGESMLEKQGLINAHPLQNPLSFSQRHEGAAHVNNTVYLVHYSPSQRVDIVR